MEVSSYITGSLTELNPMYSTTFLRIFLRTLCLLLFQALPGAAVSCSSSLIFSPTSMPTGSTWLRRLVDVQQKSQSSDHLFSGDTQWENAEFQTVAVWTLCLLLFRWRWLLGHQELQKGTWPEAPHLCAMVQLWWAARLASGDGWWVVMYCSVKPKEKC